MNPPADTTVSPRLRVKSDVEAAKVSRQKRIANVERLRFLSACGVASLHTHAMFPPNFGFGGLLVLLLLHCVFVVARPEPTEFSLLARRKAGRLLKPWLFWSVVYGAVALAKVIYLGVPFSEVFSPAMLLIGTRIHLWFLPFAFATALVLGLVHRRIVKVPDRSTVVVAAIIGAMCVFGLPFLQFGVALAAPFAQWVFGFSAIPLGLAIGRTAVLPSPKDRRNLFLLIGFLVGAACAAHMVLAQLRSGAWLDQNGNHALRYFIAVIAVCSALHWRGSLDRVSELLASSSYGIYLVHPLVATFLVRVGVLEQHPLVLLGLVLTASILITLAFQRTRLRQFV